MVELKNFIVSIPSSSLLLSTIVVLFVWMDLTNAAISSVDDFGNSSKFFKEEERNRCYPALLLPIWMPNKNLATGDIIARGIVYFVALVYMFVGVSIIADRFMASIEVITSKEREVTIKKPNGETQIINVRVWNETVSNLTLMALGSSAPEILLSIIEVYAHGFNAGELGPGTIVGSAAFNMFVIIAICVWCVPSTEYKKIKHLRVFCVTMLWSVFAYIWLYIILAWSSEGVIEIWEGLLTFLFFPATVITAYIADRRLLIYKYLSKEYRMNKRGIIVGGEGGDDMELAMTKLTENHIADGGFKVFEEEKNQEVKEFEEHRREYIQLIRELRKKNPNADMEEIEVMARDEIMNRGPKSRAFYRIQATKKLTGGSGLVKRRVEKIDDKKEEIEIKEDNAIRIFFNPAHYTVMENVGQFGVTISREGDLKSTVCVDFKTEDGTANAGSDYEPVEGTLIFRPGEAHKQVFISVIDDDLFEEDEHFYVRLSNLRYLSKDGRTPMNGSARGQTNKRPELKLALPAIATVMILDDDHGGIFSFSEAQCELSETVGEYRLKINRFSGARGKVYIPYKTMEGTAKAGKDFEMTEGEIFFDNNETSGEIPLQIIDNESYEKDAIFFVEIGEPKREEDLIKESEDEPESPCSHMSNEEKIALLGKPRLGELYKCQIRIKESKEFKNTVDKLFSKANIMVGTSSWKEQFIEAITVSAGDDDDEEDEEGDDNKKMPSCSDYVMHFFTLFWKLIFAFVPPTDYVGGWVCFGISIIAIGVLTALIGDLAFHFGCTIGLKDQVTAIAIVALGTSVPDIYGGWACFIASIIGIGILTALVGDFASHFGCTVGLKDSVTAISFVALGTSIPDTFASKVAAQNDKYADSSIGNVTGSNAVNVFLGIGIAWTMAAIVKARNNEVFEVEVGSLAYSVTLYCITALLCSAVLLLRRRLGGELGGRMLYKLPTVMLFVAFWLFYVLMSSLEAYKIIPGF